MNAMVTISSVIHDCQIIDKSVFHGQDDGKVSVFESELKMRITNGVRGIIMKWAKSRRRPRVDDNEPGEPGFTTKNAFDLPPKDSAN
jgi:hypothetical protein